MPDEEWPPEVGVKQRSPFFVAEVDYEFFDVSDKSKMQMVISKLITTCVCFFAKTRVLEIGS